MHRVLRRWEIENYLFDKEILRAYCAGENLLFAESAYDHLVKDIVNQDLKSSTSHMRKFCSIKSSVTAETFKLALAAYITPSTSVYEELRNCILDRG